GLLDRKPQRGADAAGSGRAKMGDVINLVRVQAHPRGQRDLDFVARGDAAEQVGAGTPAVLRDGENWRNVVCRMRIVRGEKSVVVIKLAHSDAVRPGRPFRRNTLR